MREGGRFHRHASNIPGRSRQSRISASGRASIDAGHTCTACSAATPLLNQTARIPIPLLPATSATTSSPTWTASSGRSPIAARRPASLTIRTRSNTSPSAVIRTSTVRRRCRSMPTNCCPAYASIRGLLRREREHPQHPPGETREERRPRSFIASRALAPAWCLSVDRDVVPMTGGRSERRSGLLPFGVCHQGVEVPFGELPVMPLLVEDDQQTLADREALRRWPPGPPRPARLEPRGTR